MLRSARSLAGDELAEPIASALTRAKEIGARMGTSQPSAPFVGPSTLVFDGSFQSTWNDQT